MRRATSEMASSVIGKLAPAESIKLVSNARSQTRSAPVLKRQLEEALGIEQGLLVNSLVVTY